MDLERLHLASRALIAGGGGALQITNLNKALFYFDLVCLRDEGETYTGAQFVALERGPVVNLYKTVLVEALAKSSHVQVEEIRVMQHSSVTLRNVGVVPDLGSERRNRLARRVGGYLGGRLAVEVSEYSHENLGWRAAYRAGSGTVIQPFVAMQQLVEADDWLDRDLEAEEIRLLAARADSARAELLPL